MRSECLFRLASLLFLLVVSVFVTLLMGGNPPEVRVHRVGKATGLISNPDLRSDVESLEEVELINRGLFNPYTINH